MRHHIYIYCKKYTHKGWQVAIVILTVAIYQFAVTYNDKTLVSTVFKWFRHTQVGLTGFYGYKCLWIWTEQPSKHPKCTPQSSNYQREGFFQFFWIQSWLNPFPADTVTLAKWVYSRDHKMDKQPEQRHGKVPKEKKKELSHINRDILTLSWEHLPAARALLMF